MNVFPKPLRKVVTRRPKKFFTAASFEVLVIRQCVACHSYSGPGAWACDVCGGTSLTWVKSHGRGTVYAVASVHQLYHECLADSIPYDIAIVELDEGLRLPARVVRDDASAGNLEIGAPVRVGFDSSGRLAVPYFIAG